MKLIIKVASGVLLALAIIAAIIIIVVVTTGGGEDRNECDTATTPYIIYVDRVDGDLVISWSISTWNRDCDVTYLLQYSIEDGPKSQVNVSGNNYTITDANLEVCSTLRLELWAVSETGNVAEPSVTLNYEEIPWNHGVTNIKYTQVAQGLRITWNRPIEMITCDVRYMVSINSDLDALILESNTENVIVPPDAYCFRINIRIYTFVGDSLRSEVLDIYSERLRIISDVDFTISPENPEEFVVTWSAHPKTELCSVEYVVEYSTDGLGEDQYQNVVIPEARFGFVYCDDAALQIRTIGLNRTGEGPWAVVDATQYPEYTFRTSFSEEPAILISWEVLPVVETCEVTYLVNITTDRDSFVNETADSSLEFYDDFYCFFISLEIQTVIGWKIGTPVIIELKNGLGQVKDLEIISEPSNDILIARWSPHRQQDFCEIEYVASYGDGIVNKTITTREGEISFDHFYCTTAFVAVEAVSDDWRSQMELIAYETGLPTSIGNVKNVVVEESLDGILTVHWDPAPRISECNTEYTVTATHPEAGIDTCTGSSSCDITLSNYCPGTDLVIQASSIDGVLISGEPISFEYIC